MCVCLAGAQEGAGLVWGAPSQLQLPCCHCTLLWSGAHSSLEAVSRTGIEPLRCVSGRTLAQTVCSRMQWPQLAICHVTVWQAWQSIATAGASRPGQSRVPNLALKLTAPHGICCRLNQCLEQPAYPDNLCVIFWPVRSLCCITNICMMANRAKLASSGGFKGAMCGQVERLSKRFCSSFGGSSHSSAAHADAQCADTATTLLH